MRIPKDMKFGSEAPRRLQYELVMRSERGVITEGKHVGQSATMEMVFSTDSLQEVLDEARKNDIPLYYEYCDGERTMFSVPPA